jgi:hypothetical protein
MPMHELLAKLSALEVELHHPGARCSAQRLSELLHPDFHEVGRSGRRYDRAACIRFLTEESAPLKVEPGAFAVEVLGDGPQAGLALLTYRSAQRGTDGALHLHTLRSSLWQLTAVGWQLRYHQGTPAAEAWP